MGYKHGGKGTRLYRIWKAMRSRCNNQNTAAFPNYGGRGISVCDEWDSFGKFREWAREYGINDTTIHYRLKAGWSTSDAITKPVSRRGGDPSEV